MSSLYGYSAENFMGQLPTVLYDDERMNALACAIAEVLAARLDELSLAEIYTRIDLLPERLLDILARDFSVGWYNFDYPIEAKRALIKTNYYVHRHLGTPKGVQEMLSAVFPGTTLEEWFDYGGEPYTFRVILDLSRARGTADASAVRRAVWAVKRESAHLENVVFQFSAGLVIGTQGRGYHYRVPLTGRLVCGTWPDRSTRPDLSAVPLTVRTAATAHGYRVPLTGRADCGTVPDRAMRPDLSGVGLTVQADGRPYAYRVPVTGTVPDRATRPDRTAVPLTAHTAADGWRYETPVAGTVPDRAMRPDGTAVPLTAHTAADGYPYRVPAAHGTGGETGGGGLVPTAELSAHPYRVRRCGTRKCGR